MTSRVTEYRIVLATGLLLGLLLLLFPGIDLAFSQKFYAGNGQWLYSNADPVIGILYRGVPAVSKALIIGLLILFLLGLWPRMTRLRLQRATIAFLLVAGLVGPGLIVDYGLKGHLGRARPVTVEAFGGTRQFTPVFVPSRECKRNCSFASGHVSGAAFAMAFGWLAGLRRRRLWLMASIALSAWVAWARMAVGAHFLSDTIFAWYAVYLGCWLTEAGFRRFGWLPPGEAPKHLSIQDSGCRHSL